LRDIYTICWLRWNIATWIREVDDEEIEIISFVIELSLILPLVSNFNNIYEYEADVEQSMVSFISS
jgi:hypothetical protein